MAICATSKVANLSLWIYDVSTFLKTTYKIPLFIIKENRKWTAAFDYYEYGVNISHIIKKWGLQNKSHAVFTFVASSLASFFNLLFFSNIFCTKSRFSSIIPVAIFIQLTLHLYAFKANIKLILFLKAFYCSCYCYIHNKNFTFLGIQPNPLQGSLRWHLFFNMPSTWLRILELSLKITSRMKNPYL